MKDYLGNTIIVGMRCVRVTVKDRSPSFVKATVVDLDGEDRFYNKRVGIITDGNTKKGYTYPERIIVEFGLTKYIKDE